LRSSRVPILLRGMDADARAWAAAVTAAGGTYSASTMSALSTFARSAKAAGYWSKLTRINLHCGSDLTAARVPLKAGGGSATETISNIVAGDYVETGATGGIKGNGTNKSFDTGFNPVSAGSSSSSCGLWTYVRGTESAGTTRTILGHTGTNIGWVNGGTVEGGFIAVAATSEVAPAANAAAEGFLGVTVNGSRNQQYYRNGAAVGAAVAATGSFTNSSLHALAFNNAGTPINFSTRYLLAYAMTTGMSAADAAAFNTHMQAFQLALGRNV
jgi:hypothetical protein